MQLYVLPQGLRLLFTFEVPALIIIARMFQANRGVSDHRTFPDEISANKL